MLHKASWKTLFDICLIWFFTSQSTIFQLYRTWSSWVEPILSKDICVLLKDTTQWRRWGSNPGLMVSSQALHHWATVWKTLWIQISWLKPAGLDLHCFKKKYTLWFSSARINMGKSYKLFNTNLLFKYSFIFNVSQYWLIRNKNNNK